MLPVIAIIGRPNVGKSTLFNCLVKRRDALVGDLPGLTRDRQYGEGSSGDRSFIVIDTGGLAESGQDGLANLMAQQAQLAITEADAIVFVVDARDGLTAADEAITVQLRKIDKPIYLVVNKVDGLNADIVAADFHALALGNPHPVAAAHGHGVAALLSEILQHFPVEEPTDELATASGIKIAIVGRPNAGKSTLVNRILGEERVVVYDTPGTTRDSIYIPMERRGTHYILIDTAGVRRRSKITEAIEKFSVVKTLQAIGAANVVIMVIDARAGVNEHDLRLIGFIIEAGKAIVIAINKWDGMTIGERVRIKSELDRRLNFIDFARIHFISALHGTGVGNLFTSVDEAYKAATQKLPTPKLTRVLQKAVAEHQPPLVHGRRVKLRYAHAGGHNPPLIVIHGNQTHALPESYRRYLMSYYRKALKLVGTPINIVLQDSANPYEGRKNTLTPRQVRKRRRIRR